MEQANANLNGALVAPVLERDPLEVRTRKLLVESGELPGYDSLWPRARIDELATHDGVQIRAFIPHRGALRGLARCCGPTLFPEE